MKLAAALLLILGALALYRLAVWFRALGNADDPYAAPFGDC